MLEQAQEYYERVRQPIVIRQAGEYLNLMTQGRYTLQASLDGKQLFAVDGSQRRVLEKQWSSGLGDQDLPGHPHQPGHGLLQTNRTDAAHPRRHPRPLRRTAPERSHPVPGLSGQKRTDIPVHLLRMPRCTWPKKSKNNCLEKQTRSISLKSKKGRYGERKAYVRVCSSTNGGPWNGQTTSGHFLTSIETARFMVGLLCYPCTA